MEYIYQLFLAFIGSLGFGLVFKINLNKVFLASCGGIICWAVYLVCGKMIGISIFGASFVATAVSAVYADRDRESKDMERQCDRHKYIPPFGEA